MAEQYSYEKALNLIDFLNDVAENNPILRAALRRADIGQQSDLHVVELSNWRDILDIIRQIDGTNVGKNSLAMQFQDLFYEFALEEYNNEYQSQTNILPRDDIYYTLFPENIGGTKRKTRKNKTRKNKTRKNKTRKNKTRKPKTRKTKTRKNKTRKHH